MSKRGGETGGDSESAKKQKMGDDEQSSVIVNPFAEATKLRDFKLIVEGKTIYVCPYFLANFSPFFDTLCLGQFAEARKGEAELKDAKYDDVLEMLNVLGADTQNLSREIDISNCVPMLYMADKWNIEKLQKKCSFFIENKFPSIPTNLAVTMKILIACEKLSFPDSALHKVASRLAAFGRIFLLEQQVHHAITSKTLYSAIVSATDDYYWISELRHENDYTSIEEDCYVADCEEKGHKCTCCGNCVCLSHNYLCPTRSLDYETAKNVELDRHFFKTWWNEKRCWGDETSV